MHEISKSYGGVAALRAVNFSVERGEVVALVGQNGAGKSTLIKVLSGAIVQDSGTIELDGKSVMFTSPAQALAAGIATVYQDPLVYPELSVTENIFLGRELRTRWGNIDRRAQVCAGQAPTRGIWPRTEFSRGADLRTKPRATAACAHRQSAQHRAQSDCVR